MKIAMIASEMAPLAKVGGLADVVGALPTALIRLGHDVRVVIPRYGSIDAARHGLRPLVGADGSRLPDAEVTEVKVGDGRVTVYCVVSQEHFGRPGIYNDPVDGKGYADNADRFIHFQKAALALLRRVGFRPDAIHCHDHQTGLIPAYIKLGGDPFYAETGTLYTIHNMGYQGLFPPTVLEQAGFDRRLFTPAGPFEFYGQVNFMKVGISFADIITTVSPTYAREICTAEQGFGLEGVLASRAPDLHGVLNGIDDRTWNPSSDPYLAHHFSASKPAGKTRCRQELLKKVGLPASRKRMAILGVVSRLTGQKGFDLIEQALPTLMQRDLKMVVLGAGEVAYSRMLTEAAAAHPDRIAVTIGFDESLAHLIEAGSDMFLMPSRYEPCGLNQMYSLVYGTVPIVRRTGGLADTVREQPEGDQPANGFVFHDYEASAMLSAVDRALSAFADRKGWPRLMKAGMRMDFSWSGPAGRYADLYAAAAERARHGVPHGAQYA